MNMKTYGNTHLVVQDEQNKVIGILNANKEIEPSLLLCLKSEYDCEIEIKKSEEPDSSGMAFFTIS